jgi:hypothetical protein
MLVVFIGYNHHFLALMELSKKQKMCARCSNGNLATLVVHTDKIKSGHILFFLQSISRKWSVYRFEQARTLHLCKMKTWWEMSILTMSIKIDQKRVVLTWTNRAPSPSVHHLTEPSIQNRKSRWGSKNWIKKFTLLRRILLQSIQEELNLPQRLAFCTLMHWWKSPVRNCAHE